MAESKYRIHRYCSYCGRYFLAKTIVAIYCCRQCIDDARNAMKMIRRREAKRIKMIDELKEAGQEYISITNAVAVFDVSRSSIRRCVLSGRVNSQRIGKKKLVVRWKDIDNLYAVRPIPKLNEPKLYDMCPEKCYTIGEIIKKFGVSETTVCTHIRKFSIPTRQIGNFVYAPKQEIDNLYKNIR